MSRVEELPDDHDESIDLQHTPQSVPSPLAAANPRPGATPTATPFPIREKAGKQDGSTPTLPPHMESVRSHTADEILEMMSQTPLFMTALEDTDGEGSENPGLEALRALQYEGPRAEVAQGFRERGNEMAKAKRWKDAKEFYTQAIAVILKKEEVEKDLTGIAEHSANPKSEEEQEAETRKEEEVEEACYINRALCNLELKNYRSTTFDCASTLRINSRNVKAYYRSSLALLALDKLPEAFDTCNRGLAIDPQNKALSSVLIDKLQPRELELRAKAENLKAQDIRSKQEKFVLTAALRARNIRTRMTAQPADMEDASIHLIPDAISPTSTLVFPVVLLYPLHAQSDFVKAFPEADTIPQHLEYIFPLPWDTAQEYRIENVEIYMESTNGGLIKVGKNMSLLRVLGDGKIEIVDGIVRVNVVPKEKAASWIQEMKARKGK